MNIYTKFKSLAKNEHYLNKYINFIIYCQNRKTNETFFEKHHILPRSIFPEYVDLKKHSWNSINLTPREHIISHIMLHYAFGGKQSVALQCMLGNFNSDTNTMLENRKVSNFHKLKFLADARKEASKYKSEIRNGKAIYKDIKGNKYFLSSNSIKINNLKLVGNNKGLKFNNKQIENLKRAKDENRVITLYFLTFKVKLSKKYNNIHLLDHYLSQGWNFSKTKDDYDINFLLGNKKISDKLKEKVPCYKNGVYIGKFLKDDKIFKEKDISTYVFTDARKDQLKKRTELAKKANKGTTVYNNGKIAIKIKEGDIIPEGFVKGGLPRPTKGKESKRKIIIEKNELLNYINEKKTLKEICFIYKLSLPTLNRILKEYNLK